MINRLIDTLGFPMVVKVHNTNLSDKNQEAS